MGISESERERVGGGGKPTDRAIIDNIKRKAGLQGLIAVVSVLELGGS